MCGNWSYGRNGTVNPVTAAKIEELVKEGYSDAGEVQSYLDQYVKSECQDQSPDKANRAYYLTPTDIRNHMYKARLGLKYLLDGSRRIGMTNYSLDHTEIHNQKM